MKSTNKFFTLLIFSIAVAFTACPAPVGSLLYSVDYIKAVPSKFMYGKGDAFKPAEDVKVIGVYGGVEDEIEITEVKIKLIYDPGFTDENEMPVDNNKVGRVLENEGPYTVVITYDKMGTDLEARYNIVVGEPGMGNGGWGDNDNGEPIIITWPSDR
jgi:hypothetical protein